METVKYANMDLPEAMPKITVSIPDSLYRTMRRYPEVRWGEVARRILTRAVDDVETMDRISRRSRLSVEDVDELDHLLKSGLWRRYRGPPNP